MHKTSDMAKELEQGFYPGFEGRWRIGTLVARVLMGVVIVATLFGLLGGGPVSLWTRTVRNGPMEVQYPPVVRFGTPTGFTIDAAVQAGTDQVVITLNKSLVGQFGLQGVFPRPKEWRTGADGNIELVLAVRPGTDRAIIRLGGMPASSGVIDMWARLTGRDGSEIHWSQVVLP